MKSRPVTIPRILVLLMLATALCGLGLSFAGKTGERHLPRGPLAVTAEPAATPTPTGTPTPTPFSHPLLFPPVATEANVSIGIDEACVQILDGPCTNMWTYGGTYPGITIRRPT